MMTDSRSKGASLMAFALALAGCGGGGAGGGGVASTPPPPPPPQSPPPPPASASAVEIFQSPATQEFTALSIGSDLRIRYDARSNTYEVMAGGSGWTTLIDDPLQIPPAGEPNVSFRFGAGRTQDSSFLVRASYRYSDPNFQYRYSNLADWSVAVGVNGATSGAAGSTVFGMATPPGGVPVTGSGSYRGFVDGVSTVSYLSQGFGFEGQTLNAGIEGSVDLRFDFAAGSLAGQIHPYLNEYGGDFERLDLGTFAFAQTVFSKGSQSFSGKFATSASGANGFSGLFTGPNAEELIGRFDLPFVYPANGSTQSATGVWIAKR